jgi:DNA invertase Pin-like site-specific DNA recombinase
MHVYGYIRASDLPEIESPQAQQRMIENYCQRGGQEVHAHYVDASDSGKQPLHGRKAGGRLWLDLRRDDHVVLARLDRLADSFLDAVNILDSWVRYYERGEVKEVSR